MQLETTVLVLSADSETTMFILHNYICINLILANWLIFPDMQIFVEYVERHFSIPTHL